MSFEQGLNLFKEQKYEEAEKKLRKEAKSAEADSATIELYAFTLQKLGRFEEALGFWNILISREKENPEYLCERGVCKFNLGYKSAIEDFDIALKLDPENPYRHSTRAYVLDKMGRTEEAYHGYLNAVELDPEDEITHNNLGIVEQKLGYTAASRKRFADQEKRLGLSEIQSGAQNTTNYSSTRANEEADSPKKGNLKSEVLKMMSSPKEFKAFLKEAIGLFKKDK